MVAETRPSAPSILDMFCYVEMHSKYLPFRSMIGTSDITMKRWVEHTQQPNHQARQRITTLYRASLAFKDLPDGAFGIWATNAYREGGAPISYFYSDPERFVQAAVAFTKGPGSIDVIEAKPGILGNFLTLIGLTATVFPVSAWFLRIKIAKKVTIPSTVIGTALLLWTTLLRGEALSTIEDGPLAGIPTKNAYRIYRYFGFRTAAQHRKR